MSNLKEKASPLNYVVLQVRGKKIIEYDRVDYLSYCKSEEQLNLISKQKITYQGEMSPAAQIKMKRIILCWSDAVQQFNKNVTDYNSASFRKFVFITLTLPSYQFHSDKDLKKSLLAPFMRNLRENCQCENYIWKAESQENGNLHFHVIVDQFVSKVLIDKYWLNALESMGYLDEFEKKHGHRNPPCCNVQLVKNQHDIEKYIGKYVGKSENYRKIDGAVWKCSKKLSSLRFFEIERDRIIEQNLQKYAVQHSDSFKSTEHCNIYNIGNDSVEQFLSNSALRFYKCYLLALREFLFLSTDANSFSSFYDNYKVVNGLKPVRYNFEKDRNLIVNEFSLRKKLKKISNVKDRSLMLNELFLFDLPDPIRIVDKNRR